jgi:uncharacterized oxidoreductase
MRYFQVDELHDIGQKIFTACGAPVEEAAVLIDELVASSLMGVDSHGVSSIGQYVQEVRDGIVVPGAPLEVMRDHGALMVVDCGFNFGIVQALKATDLLAARVRETGIACAVAERSHHVGRLGTYPQRLAEAGLIGLAFACGSTKYRRLGRVAPWGGAGGRISTNPIAYAVPNGDWPILFDMTTASIPQQKLKILQRAGKQAPAGYLIDGQGRDTQDPGAVLDGDGAILPFGGIQGHKGYGLALLAEMLSGFLPGDTFGDDVKRGRYCNAFTLITIDPEASCGRGAYEALIADYSAYIKSSPPRDPKRPVILPGELERSTMEERRRDGIPVSSEEWENIRKHAALVGVSL